MSEEEYAIRDLRIEDFEDRVGDRFEIATGGEGLTLELTRAQALPKLARESGSFRLEFVGPGEPILPQGTYKLRAHDDEFDIFIVPVARDAKGTTYEAVFN